MKDKSVVYVGFNRPMSKSMHTFVLKIAEALKKKRRTAVFPKGRARLFDAAPEDGLWSAQELAVNCGAALFVFDQDESGYDAMVQIGCALSARLPIFCIVVRRSACASCIVETIKANKWPLFETHTLSLSDASLEGFFAKEDIAS